MHRVTPKVFLVGETKLHSYGVDDYLKHVGTSWQPHWLNGSLSDSERLVELFGRLCYRSWEPGLNPNVTKVREGNAEYLANVIQSKHGSVLEHVTTNWIFADVSRVLTHELVRHRAGMAFSQESLRFVRLTDLGLWLPDGTDPALVTLFEETFQTLEALQLKMAQMLGLDGSADFHYKKTMTSLMRRAAPIGLATTIGVTFNMRALRHIGELRTSAATEVEFRVVMDQVMRTAKARWPNLFADFSCNEAGEWVPASSKI